MKIKSYMMVLFVTIISVTSYFGYNYDPQQNLSLVLANIEAFSQDEQATSYPEPVNCGTIKCKVHPIFDWQWGKGHICPNPCTSYSTAEELKNETNNKKKEQCWCTGPRQNLDASTQQRYGWCFPKDKY